MLDLCLSIRRLHLFLVVCELSCILSHSKGNNDGIKENGKGRRPYKTRNVGGDEGSGNPPDPWLSDLLVMPFVGRTYKQELAYLGSPRSSGELTGRLDYQDY